MLEFIAYFHPVVSSAAAALLSSAVVGGIVFFCRQLRTISINQAEVADVARQLAAHVKVSDHAHRVTATRLENMEGRLTGLEATVERIDERTAAQDRVLDGILGAVLSHREDRHL